MTSDRFSNLKMINSREEWFLTTLTNLQIVAITEREIPFTTLSPGQTLATFQRNILQNCSAQHVAHLWPPCYSMLQHVACCWVKFENDQIFLATF